MGLLDRLRKKSDACVKPAASQNDSVEDTQRYRGVEVVANNDACCQAAKDIEGRRFLLSQVPMLPLTDCDAGDCRCTYERFDDRRSDLRRASDVTFDVLGQFQDQEHRSEAMPGRREKD